MRTVCGREQAAGKRVGFVPTMGSLHAGHLSLLRAAREACDVVICSIFVNPRQFDSNADFLSYPRTVDQDASLLRGARCDILFRPEAAALYPVPTRISFDFGSLSSCMEGVCRAGHLSGVALVVSKLLYLIPADCAYFGQKDWQQYLIVRQLTRELFLSTEIVVMPTIREPSGLAYSSRNSRMSKAQKKEASTFHEALLLAKEQLLSGASVAAVERKVSAFFANREAVSMEYFHILHRDTLAPPSGMRTGERQALGLFIAGRVGDTRVIDNVLVSLA